MNIYLVTARRQAAIALLVMLGLILAGIPRVVLAQSGKTFHYTATTKAAAAKQGVVVASGIRWQCKGSRCTVSGAWPEPGVMACRALARQVGTIISYGHAGAGLNAARLSECNGSSNNGGSSKFNNEVISETDDSVPPFNKKEMTPGPISGPKAETLPNVPMGVLETARPTGELRTAQQTWYCEGTRCTIPRRDEPLNARRAVEDCSRLAQAGGRVVWFTDGRRPFDSERLAQCNSPYVRNFEIFACSGPDDLRDASHLKIGFTLNDRNFTDANYRRILSTGIAANSCQFHFIAGPAFRLGNLRSIQLRFQSYDSGLYQTEDNWDMTRFTIIATAIEPGGRRVLMKIVDEKDGIVKRFSSDRKFWRIAINPRHGY